MNYIRLKNIRSFDDSGKVELAPLTVLLGKNSSGKSTFLRMFPLFKQSWNNKNVGALALYGDSVDFGDFDSIITTNAKSRFIGMEFDLEFLQNRRHYSFMASNNKKTMNCTCELKIKKLKSSNILYCSYIKITIGRNTIIISVKKDARSVNIKVNHHNYKEFANKIHIRYNNISTCFPSFLDEGNNTRSIFFPYQQSFLAPLEKRLGHNWDEKSETYHLLEMIPFVEKKELTDFLSMARFENFGKNLLEKLNSDEGISCYHDILFALIPGLIENIRQNIFMLCQNIYYSKPLRANAERYYRIQSLTTNEIAPDGSNLISFISNMGSLKNEFEKWTQDNLGFIIKIHTETGHQSIFLQEQTVEYNVTDMGFGFSQIIPIIVQLWDISKKRKTNYSFRSNEFIYAVEQPELHLHPALQAKVVKLFCDVLNLAIKNEIKLKIIIETHSETMINYLGKLIAAKKFDSDNIKLHIFEKTAGSKITTIKESSYTHDGVLKNWPFGFFSTEKEF